MHELLGDEVAFLAGGQRQAGDLLRDALLLLEGERDGGDVVRESVCGAATAGITTCSPESRRYCTIIIAWFRSSSACR